MSCSQVVQDADRPVFVHPGPVPADRRRHARPGGPPVVDYPASCTPPGGPGTRPAATGSRDLRICFAAGAGLGPAHHERFRARGGRSLAGRPGHLRRHLVLLRQGVDALTRALGVDPIVVGSDRPYGVPHDTDLGDAARLAFRHTNPAPTPDRRTTMTSTGTREAAADIAARLDGPTVAARQARPHPRTRRDPRTLDSLPGRDLDRRRAARLASSSPPTRAAAAAHRLQRRQAALRQPAPGHPRRRLAAVLDAAERHRLARPRHLLRRGRGAAGRADRAQPGGRRRRASAPRCAPATAYSFGPDHIHRLTGRDPGSVSVHAYSPPLWRMGQYTLGPGGLLRRRIGVLRRRAAARAGQTA